MLSPVSHKPTNFPYVRHSSNSDAIADVGGVVLQFTAGGTLKLGEAVYLSAAKTVNKSETLANHGKRVGIVVGGDNIPGSYVITDPAAYNVLVAATVGQLVYVLAYGISYVITAAAADPGDKLILDTVTAGRVKAGAALSGTAGDLDATVDEGSTPVTSTAANGGIITITGDAAVAGDSNTRIIGMLLETASGANQIKKALIYLA